MNERYKLSKHVVHGLEYKKNKDARGRLAVECWCHRQLVWVTPDDIWRGVTASCGHRECRP